MLRPLPSGINLGQVPRRRTVLQVQMVLLSEGVAQDGHKSPLGRWNITSQG